MELKQQKTAAPSAATTTPKKQAQRHCFQLVKIFFFFSWTKRSNKQGWQLWQMQWGQHSVGTNAVPQLRSLEQALEALFPLFLVNEQQQQQQQQFGWQHISEKKPLFLLFSCSLSSSFSSSSSGVFAFIRGERFCSHYPRGFGCRYASSFLQLLATTINVMIFCLPFSFSSRLAATICTHCLSSQCAV